ncbi:MAG: HAD-IB family phosphatase [Deltaproteobacteria bacterium]|nr:HAD-IB family phosphatase [Deltaproteobacteria bacterium]
MQRQALFLSVLFLFGACRSTGGWSPEVDGLVAGLIEARKDSPDRTSPRPLAVFDFDNTLIDGDISHTLLTFQADHLRYGFDPADPESRVFPAATAALFKTLGNDPEAGLRERLRRQIRFKVLQRYYELWKEGGKEAGLAFLVQVLKGLTREEVYRLTRDAMDRALNMARCLRTHEPHGLSGEPVKVQEGIRLRPAMDKMIRRLRDAGFDLWVVSASPEWLVEEAVRAYGVPPEKVLGNRSSEKDGRLTGDLLTPVTYRQGKVDAIRQFIGRRPALVFGDAWTDWEMLKWAEHGVLIDRDKADLNQAARESGVAVQPRFPDEPKWSPCDSGPPLDKR